MKVYIPEKHSLKAIIYEWKISPVTLEMNPWVLHIFLWGCHCLFLKLAFLMHHFLNNDLILVTSKLFYLGIFDSGFQKIFLFVVFPNCFTLENLYEPCESIFYWDMLSLQWKTQSSGHISENLKNLHQCQLLNNNKKINNAKKTEEMWKY